MKIRLFKVPFVDDDGLSRERLGAAVVGADLDDGPAFTDMVEQLQAALASGSNILAFEDHVDIGWL